MLYTVSDKNKPKMLSGEAFHSPSRRCEPITSPVFGIQHTPAHFYTLPIVFMFDASAPGPLTGSNLRGEILHGWTF